ncbi:MAG: SRPBCC family protein [Jiangellaceae bacterium]
MTSHASDPTTLAPVRCEVTVPGDPTRAFEIFTAGHDSWKTPEHYLGAEKPEVVILESASGGRWYERAADGTECEWGRVLESDPPHRIVLAWQVGGDWQYHADEQSRVEVTFTEVAPGRTRVVLVHDGFEGHGDGAAVVHQGVGDEDGWPVALDLFTKAVAAG